MDEIRGMLFLFGEAPISVSRLVTDREVFEVGNRSWFLVRIEVGICYLVIGRA